MSKPLSARAIARYCFLNGGYKVRKLREPVVPEAARGNSLVNEDDHNHYIVWVGSKWPNKIGMPKERHFRCMYLARGEIASVEALAQIMNQFVRHQWRFIEEQDLNSWAVRL